MRSPNRDRLFPRGVILPLLTVLMVLGVATEARSADLSGRWNSNIGLVYEITQTGERFTWHVASSRQVGNGEIRRQSVTATWEGPRGGGSASGRIVATDAENRALRIEWSNGVVFFREPPPPPQLKPLEGWCCSDGEVSSGTVAECRRSGGKFFESQGEAERSCAAQATEEGWCCARGRVVLITPQQCSRAGGEYTASREEAERICGVDRPPAPSQGWCCVGGEVLRSSGRECQREGGQFFEGPDEAERQCRVPTEERRRTPPTSLTMGSFVLDVESYESFAWRPRHEVFQEAAGVATTSLTCDGQREQFVVGFEGLVIEPASKPNTGKVIEGQVRYPDERRTPAAIVLPVAGFHLHLERLVLFPDRAGAAITVEFPAKLLDLTTGEPPTVLVNRIPVEAGAVCDFIRDLPNTPYGPWAILGTGLEVQGAGLSIDFSSRLNPAHRIADVSWRGVFLGPGETVAAPDGTVVSNTGYRLAHYEFDFARVTGAGLSATLSLSSPWRFRTLRPLGYGVSLEQGELSVFDNRIVGGEFHDGEIRVPKTAVIDASGQHVQGHYSTMIVEPDLDLHADVDINRDLHWGELTDAAETFWALQRKGVKSIAGHAYFSSVHQPRYRPLIQSDVSAVFAEPGLDTDLATDLETQGLQGISIAVTADDLELVIETPDVPSPASRPFRLSLVAPSWINLAARGVHGSLQSETPLGIQLGPTGRPYYKGRIPFDATIEAAAPAGYSMRLRFVDSAVFSSDAAGHVTLTQPTNDALGFKKLGLTSTAHIPAASIDLTTPLEPEFWGIKVVGKQGHFSAGALSVKTGLAVFTAAGLAEERHFAQPIWLTWAELLADGDWGRFFIDHNSAGQRFDGFRYVPGAVSLSEYLPAKFDRFDPNKQKPHLEVGGSVYYDFFGGYYLHIKDHNTPLLATTYPQFGRDIELSYETDSAGGFGATARDIHGTWSTKDWKNGVGGFGVMDFDLRYNDALQDGFLGEGTADFMFFSDVLNSSAILQRGRICLRIEEEQDRFLELGVTSFASVNEIYGCGCIEDGRLQQLNLQAALGASATSILGSSTGVHGSVEMIMTPATSEFRAEGALILGLFEEGGAGDVSLTGQIRFFTDFENSAIEGTIEGSIDASALAGGATLSGNGKLDWRFASDSNWIQGRLGMNLVTTALGGGAEGGLFVGANVPSAKAWVLRADVNRFQLNLDTYPVLTGVFGYGAFSASGNFGVLSGGYEVFAGFGAFLHAQLADSQKASGFDFPYVVGHMGVHIWGKLMAGVVSAGAWGEFSIHVPQMYFSGKVGLEGCALWAFCVSLDVHVRLAEEGFSLT